MVRNEEKYQLATHYRKRGFTYTEIAKICDVSKGTVSTWLSKKAFSMKVKKDNVEIAGRDNAKRIKLLHKARQAERTARYREAVRSAETEFKHYKKDPLFMVGIAVYMTQGDMGDTGVIRLSCQRVEAQRVFIKFIREYLGAIDSQIRFWLLLYPAHKESECKSLWSKALKLKSNQFGKSQVIQGHKQGRTLHFGVGNTIIGSTVLKRKLLRWIELASKDLQ